MYLGRSKAIEACVGIETGHRARPMRIFAVLFLALDLAVTVDEVQDAK